MQCERRCGSMARREPLLYITYERVMRDSMMTVQLETFAGCRGRGMDLNRCPPIAAFTSLPHALLHIAGVYRSSTGVCRPPRRWKHPAFVCFPQTYIRQSLDLLPPPHPTHYQQRSHSTSTLCALCPRQHRRLQYSYSSEMTARSPVSDRGGQPRRPAVK
ncbi:hypothetical protein BDW22DRAFT_956098 [Trametopsis cervina]|nr:hypothetical protein BDW22DRAFT_956098 [Trametopsis cervina]